MHEKSWATRPVLESNKHCHFGRSICLSRQEQTTHFIMQLPPISGSGTDMVAETFSPHLHQTLSSKERLTYYPQRGFAPTYKIEKFRKGLHTVFYILERVSLSQETNQPVEKVLAEFIRIPELACPSLC